MSEATLSDITTIGQAIWVYLEYRYDRGYAPGTLTNNRTALVSLAEHLGLDEPIGKARRRDIEEWVQRRLRGLDPGTVRGRMSSVSKFYTWCVRRELRPDNPAFDLERPPVRRKPPRALSPAQVAAVIAACRDNRDRLIVALMVGHALRAVEVERLNVCDIDLDSQMLWVTGKGSHEREVPLTPHTEVVLAAYLDEYPVGGPRSPVVRSYKTNGRVLARTLSRMLSGIFYRAGVKTAPRDGMSGHALRHTCLSDFYEATGDIILTGELAGHSSIATTQRYMRRGNKSTMRAALEGRT